MNAPTNSGSPDRAAASALSATLYLMTRIALQGGCPRLALIVMEHLDLLAADPGVDPLVRATTHQLFFDWQRHAEATYVDPAACDDAVALARDAIRKAMGT
jgi:hypothetical protein